MRRSHFTAWAPHCPVCARDRGQMPALGLADGATEHDDDVLSGILICAEPTCRHEYPVIDGIPIITGALRQHLGDRAIELLLRDDLDPAVFSLLGDALGADSWLDILRQGISTYAWDAYADQDPAEDRHDAMQDPNASIPRPGAARRCLTALLNLAGVLRPASRVLDLGCAAGRTAFDCAAAAPQALVLGVDSNLALLRLGRRAATRGDMSYGRRRIGLVYDERRFAVDLPGRDRVDFWACDGAALPFAPGRADLVLALNLLDCVPDPLALLHVMAAALSPDGALLLATPFDWAARATPVTQWIGGHSQRSDARGAAEPLLQALLRDGGHDRAVNGLTVIGTGETIWHTRLHERSTVMYRSHLVALRRQIVPGAAGQRGRNG